MSDPTQRKSRIAMIATLILANANSAEAYTPTKQRDTSKLPVRLWIVHMSLMLFALLIVIPFGILFARYSRSYVSNMSRKHSIIQYTGFLLVFIGFFVSVAGMQITHQPHFKGDHQILGLTVFLLLFVQVFLGEVGKALMKNKRIRYVNYFHALLGTFTFGLSIWTMATGFKVWSWFPPKWAMYPIYAWVGVLFFVYALGFLLIPRERRIAAKARELGDTSLSADPLAAAGGIEKNWEESHDSHQSSHSRAL